MLGPAKVGFSFRVHSVKELIDFTTPWPDVVQLEENADKGGCVLTGRGVVFTTIICFDLTISADLSTSQLSIFS